MVNKKMNIFKMILDGGEQRRWHRQTTTAKEHKELSEIAATVNQVQPISEYSKEPWKEGTQPPPPIREFFTLQTTVVLQVVMSTEPHGEDRISSVFLEGKKIEITDGALMDHR